MHLSTRCHLGFPPGLPGVPRPFWVYIVEWQFQLWNYCTLLIFVYNIYVFMCIFLMSEKYSCWVILSLLCNAVFKQFLENYCIKLFDIGLWHFNLLFLCVEETSLALWNKICTLGNTVSVLNTAAFSILIDSHEDCCDVGFLYWFDEEI